MMNVLVTKQTLLFLTAIQIGILMGIIFDLIRIFRKLIKHPNIFVQIEDMLYWVVSGFIGFYMLYICNYAAIRPYIFIGMILGGLFYFLSFSIWFMKLATIAIEYLKKVIVKMVQCLIIPIKAVTRWILSILGLPINYIDNKLKAFKHFVKLASRKKQRLKYEQKMDKKVEQYLKNGKT